MTKISTFYPSYHIDKKTNKEIKKETKTHKSMINLPVLTIATAGLFLPLNINAQQKQDTPQDSISNQRTPMPAWNFWGNNPQRIRRPFPMMNPFIFPHMMRPNKENVCCEGVDNDIDYILISNQYADTKKIRKEVKKIGKEVGFDVLEIPAVDNWAQDPVIVRNDHDLYYTSSGINFNNIDTLIIKPREQVSKWWQGMVSVNNSADEYKELLKNIPVEQKSCKSYLEGGNILTTRKKNGRPGAIIGEESIPYTIYSMAYWDSNGNTSLAANKLKENNPLNTIVARGQIAHDLGLMDYDIAYIPQFDFHIDMYYHPLHDGEIAVPDYDEGIKILKENKIKSMPDATKQSLIVELEKLNKKVKPFTEKAEETLQRAGYETKKIPCFSVINKEVPNTVPLINYVNGFGGETKDRKSFFVTNTSGYPELDKIMTNYYKKAGIDKIYFISSNNYLRLGGGIGCLTLPISSKKDTNNNILKK